MRLTVYRHAAYDTPWRVLPSARGGRFHRPGQDTVQYASLHPLGPGAEMLRHHVGPDGDPHQVLLNLWTAAIDVGDVAWVDFGDCRSYGRTADELVGDDYRPTLELADTVRAAGAAAMIAHSAALPGAYNVILFGARLAHPFLWEPIMPEEIPTGHLSDGARPAAEVTAHVRWFGTPHAAAEQWKRTGSYDKFDDPIATRW